MADRNRLKYYPIMPSRSLAIVMLCVLALLVCYGSFLRGMWNQWSTDEDMGHGFVVPWVICYFVWKDRARLSQIPRTSRSAGFVLLAVGAGLHVAAMIGMGLFAGCLAFLISLTGVIAVLAGPAMIRALAFPLFLSLFMLPKLAIVYNQVTLPMQLLASRLAAGMLSMAHIGVLRDGNILEVHTHRIEVAEACNGIRYLLPLSFLSLVLGYLTESKIWIRGALLAVTVPLAILANASRVALAAADPALADGWPHLAFGVFVFVVCLGALALSRRMLDQVHESFAP